MQSHRKFGLEHVVQYLRYEHQVGPAHPKVDSVSFAEVTVRPMQGWANRYVTAGTAHYEYWDTANVTSSRGKIRFEVHTDIGPDEGIRVVFFDKKA